MNENLNNEISAKEHEVNNLKGKIETFKATN